ncbi:MAG: DUF2141 domain-containing protein [Melioribacteraceae bacterium]|nr:DUF2141 domain-containing protein [Melioribacteraceae bacterium]
MFAFFSIMSLEYKNILLLLSVLLIFTCNWFLFAHEQEIDSGRLIVKITGFQNNTGFALTALSRNEEEFESEDEPELGGPSKIVNLESEFIFENLLFGIYTLKVFHDEDMNYKLNKNFLGMPSEDYGFSNNVRGTFGIPDFVSALFKFDSTNQTINIILD